MEKHNLTEDFPEYKEKMQELKTNNQHFKKLFDEYDVVNQDIHRIDTGAEVVSEEVVNDLHSKRVHLKDQIYTLLRK